MNWTELLNAIGFTDKSIIVTIINPVRKEEVYKSGRVIGFKPGVYGGGHSNWYKDKEDRDGGGRKTSHSFSSMEMYWKKKPRVLVEYNCFIYGKSVHWDWIDVDNCIFEIK